MSKKSIFVLVVLALSINNISLIFASDISSLIKDLKDKDSAKDASYELAKIGKPAVPELIKALESRNKYQKRYSARAIREMGQAGSDAIPALKKLLKDWDTQTREYAVEALGNMVQQVDQVIPILKRARKDNNKDVRKKAKKAIEKLRSKLVEPIKNSEEGKSANEKLGTTLVSIEKQIEEAKKAIDTTSFHFGEESEAYKNLGDLYYKSGNYTDAIRCYDIAIEDGIGSDQYFGKAYKGRGSSYAQIGNYYEALGNYKKAIYYDPDNKDVYGNMCLIYYKLENYEEAIKACEKALTLDHNSVAIYRILGICYSKQNQNQLAIKYAQKAIKDYPNDYELLLNVGFAYYKLGNFYEAINLFKKAIEIKPNILETYIKLANTYYDSSKYQEAVNAYKKAVKLNPNSFDAYKGLVNVCGKIGNQEGVENAKNKLMILFYEKYKNKYAWYNDQYIELLDYDPNKYAWCYNKTVTPKDPYVYSLTEFDEKVLSALMDFKWRVGEYGLIADKQIFQILNQNEMLVIYGTGLNQEIAHFSGWSTKKMIDGQQWNPGEVVAIIGTYRYTTSIGTVKTIPDVVPAKLFRKGITFEQFKDILKKNNDLPEDLQKVKAKFLK